MRQFSGVAVGGSAFSGPCPGRLSPDSIHAASHSRQLAADLLLSFLHPHQPQCSLRPQVPLLPFLLAQSLEYFCIIPSSVFGALLSLISLLLSRVGRVWLWLVKRTALLPPNCSPHRVGWLACYHLEILESPENYID